MVRSILFLTLLLFSVNLSAQDRKFQLTQFTYEGITKTQKLMDENRTSEAKEVLIGLENSKKVRKKLDRAYIRFYLGYFNTLIDEPKEAIKYFKASLAYEALAPAQTSNAYLNLVQLSMDAENYKEALFYLNALMQSSVDKKARHYVNRAQIQMILKEYAEVIKDIDIAFEMEGERKEPWLKMQYYSYYMLKDYAHAMEVLKELIELDPYSKENWLQLSSLYSLSEASKHSLSALELATIAGLDLSENEILRLVSWIRYSDIPYHAAQLMEKKMDAGVVSENVRNFNTLGDLYYESKETMQALKWYQKSLDADENVKIYFKLAKLYANVHDYKKSALILERSLVFNKTDKAAERYLLLGRAYYELKNKISAKKAFYKALEFEKSKKMAQAWLDYL